MRAQRYKFPDGVRSTTRAIASRMVRDGTVADTPEALDAWIAGTPDAREPLERGGYGTAFTAYDLFPLLQVFLVQAGWSPPAADPPPRSPGTAWLAGLLLVLVVLVLLAAWMLWG